MVSVILVVLTVMGVVPFMAPNDEEALRPTAAYVASGVVVAALAVVVGVLKPKVPVRGPGQTTAQYWAVPGVVSKVQMMWFLLDSASMIAAVAYAMTGHLLLAAVLAAAVAVFWWMGPNQFTVTPHNQRL